MLLHKGLKGEYEIKKTKTEYTTGGGRMGNGRENPELYYFKLEKRNKTIDYWTTGGHKPNPAAPSKPGVKSTPKTNTAMP